MVKDALDVVVWSVEAHKSACAAIECLKKYMTWYYIDASVL